MTRETGRIRGARRLVRAALALAALLDFPALAQTTPEPPGAAANADPGKTDLSKTDPSRTDPAVVDRKAADLDRQKAEYQSVQDTLAQSAAQRKKIETEIESIRNDRAKLTAASIDAREKVEAAEAQLAAVEERLGTLGHSESAIRKSLDGRRDVLAAVLAVLQRMGRKPPPALLTRPEDVLRAIRASMMLGAVLPQLRAETEALASDLQDLVSLRAAIAQERARQGEEAEARRNERARLDALIAARQNAIGQAEEALAAERKRADALGGRAASLRDLIGRMEGELAGARAAAEKARAAEEARARQSEKEAEEARARFADAQKRDPARLAPAIAFAQAKGLLSLPANGTVIKYYGAPSDFGGAEKGLSLATRSQAIVSSPCDGYIAFSGPWRSYGQLLIVNAGRRLLCRLGRHGRMSMWRSDSSSLRASRSGRWGTEPRKPRPPSPLARASRCFMSNFARTGRQSIRDPGGSGRTNMRVRG